MRFRGVPAQLRSEVLEGGGAEVLKFQRVPMFLMAQTSNSYGIGTSFTWHKHFVSQRNSQKK